MSNKSTSSNAEQLFSMPMGAPLAEEQTFLAKAAKTQQEKLEKLMRRMQGPQLQIPIKSKKDKGKLIVFFVNRK